MQYTILVIEIEDQVVKDVTPFTGERSVISAEAESKFLLICHENMPMFYDYNKSEVNSMLVDGYVTFNNGSVNICWI